MSIEALDKEESREYFILPQNLDCNDDHGLGSNREDQYSHRKILWNGRLDVIEDLDE